MANGSHPTLVTEMTLRSSPSATESPTPYSTARSIGSPDSDSSYDSSCSVCRAKIVPQASEREETSEQRRDLDAEVSQWDNVEKLLHDSAANGDLLLIDHVLKNSMAVQRNMLRRQTQTESTAEENEQPDEEDDLVDPEKLRSSNQLLNSVYFGETMLAAAIKNRHAALAKWLILRGIDLDIVHPEYDYYKEITKRKVLVAAPTEPSPKKKKKKKKKPTEPEKPKPQTVAFTTHCVNYYEVDYRHLAYINELYDIAFLLDSLSDRR